MAQLEIKFDSGDRHIELKMDGLDSEIQFKILELCMNGTRNQEETEKKIDNKIESENNDTVKLFESPVKEKLDEPLIIPQKIKQDSFNRSIQTRLGVKHYQLFYICTDCGKKGKHHILPGTPKVHCHNPGCAKEMMVRQATPKGLPDHDEWGNYYIAGEFKMSMKDKEEEEKFLKEEENRPLISIN